MTPPKAEEPVPTGAAEESPAADPAEPAAEPVGEGIGEMAARILASAHELAAEIESDARARAGEIERDAGRRGEVLIAEAEAERERIAAELHALVTNAGEQVNELLRVRDELRGEVRNAVRNAGNAMDRISEQYRDNVPAAPEPEAAALAMPPGEPVEPAGSEVVAVPAAEFPGPGDASRPVSLAAARADRDARESESQLSAAPLAGIAEVTELQGKVAALPGVQSVDVQSFSGDRAEMMVRSDHPERLAVTLRAIPAVVGVDDSGPGLIVTLRPSSG